MPPRLGEPGIAACQGLTDRDVTQDHNPSHCVWVVQRQPLDDVATPVMTDSTEALVSQARHELDQVLGHRSLAGLRVVGQIGGCRRLAIAAQVRAHDPVAGGRYGGSDPVPSRVRPGMSVDQQDCRTGPAVPDTEPNPPDVKMFGLEAVKHAATLPALRRRRSSNSRGRVPHRPGIQPPRALHAG